MLRNRLLILSIAIFLFVVTLIVLPTITTQSSFCSNSIAAQGDDACLAEKATISAMQVELQQVSFQATLDTINHQATLTAVSSADGFDYPATIIALESELEALRTSGAVAIPPTPVPGLPFVENFDDNSRGWDLTAKETGVARLSQNQLLITANPSSVYWHPIPQLMVEEFYIETTVTVIGQYTGVGFGLGNTASEQFHAFVVGENNVQFFEQATRLFKTDYGQLWRRNEPVTIGLEATGGLYTVFVGDKQTETAQITPFGNQVGILVRNGNGRGSSDVYFDEIVVRQSR